MELGEAAPPAPEAPVGPLAAAGGAPVAAAAAQAPSGGRAGHPAVGFGPGGGSPSEQMLAALQESLSSLPVERGQQARERRALTNRLLQLDQDLQAEERIGCDLARRLEALEAALESEQLVGDVEPPAAAGPTSGPAGASSRPSQNLPEALELDMALARELGLTPSAVLATCLERVPRTRERSCREYLRDCLREGGITHRQQQIPEAFTTASSTSSPSGSPGAREEGSSAARRRQKAEAEELQPLASSAVAAAASSSSSVLPAWAPRWTLRSHLDGVRCVLADAANSVLASCGEDMLIKTWDLRPLWRGAPHADDMEPFATLRGHTAPVLAMAYSEQDGVLFSGGMDECIRAWRWPDVRTYNAYGSCLMLQDRGLRAGVLLGHKDSIWSLQQHPHLPFLASAAADGLVAIWSTKAVLDPACAAGTMETSFVLPAADRQAADPEVPACAAWVPSEVSHILAGYVSARVAVFDVMAGRKVLEVAPPPPVGAQAEGSALTSACCHQVQRLVATGHADCRARLLDLASGRFVGDFGGHSDAVTSVCIDPTRGNSLVTACHDGCIRTFDLRMAGCQQTLWLHRSKYDEAVHGLHHAPRMLATAGADGNVSVLLPSD